MDKERDWFLDFAQWLRGNENERRDLTKLHYEYAAGEHEHIANFANNAGTLEVIAALEIAFLMGTRYVAQRAQIDAFHSAKEAWELARLRDGLVFQDR